LKAERAEHLQWLRQPHAPIERQLAQDCVAVRSRRQRKHQALHPESRNRPPAYFRQIIGARQRCGGGMGLVALSVGTDPLVAMRCRTRLASHRAAGIGDRDHHQPIGLRIQGTARDARTGRDRHGGASCRRQHGGHRYQPSTPPR
jgi:hypothetical protein